MAGLLIVVVRKAQTGMFHEQTKIRCGEIIKKGLNYQQTQTTDNSMCNVPIITIIIQPEYFIDPDMN